MSNDDFRRAIEAIKLRTPIEDVVRERVPGLKKRGNLWEACCPFHEEKTPSFKVDPRRGTWHCFGSCGAGGDQISFLERFDNLGFRDVIEILAGRAGVELPKSRDEIRGSREASDAVKRGTDLLERAARFYADQLSSPEGAAAVRYQQSRGLTDSTAKSFGVGYAPASGQVLVQALRAKAIDFELAVAVGLARKNDQGRPYDFFRGRWMIPIRDPAGRVVGFGARRLSDGDESGPKYINTPETATFHKGRLIYALDRALPHVRKSGHVILVEGYTDVMAAHQAGVENVVAVLGTATTEDHAALIRKSGARRVSLVFDGDDAGRKAAYRALFGILPLSVTIDVVSLSGGVDPCDLIVRSGREGFLAEVARAEGWFDFVARGLAAHSGLSLAQEVDRVLELFARVVKPVYRESLMLDLARHLGMPVETLRENSRLLSRPRDRQAPPGRTADAPPGRTADVPATTARDRDAFELAIGALLCDTGLIPFARRELLPCPDAELQRILDVLYDLHADPNAALDVAGVLSALADDPVRTRVEPLMQRAQTADSARDLLEGQITYLKNAERDRERRLLVRRFVELDEAHGAESRPDVVELTKQYQELSR